MILVIFSVISSCNQTPTIIATDHPHFVIFIYIYIYILVPSKYFESPMVFRQISVDLNITTKIPSKRFTCFSQESPRKMHGEKEPRKIIFPTKTSMAWGIPKVSGSCLGSQCGFTTNAGSGDTGTQGTAMERKVMTGKLGERNCSMLEP